ncbi:MAG: NAD(P)H-hydrate epimerase [Tissierellia bacterium]|nr:NAD(P)H-hydrate epimerase [Tissierellia bacterium]
MCITPQQMREMDRFTIEKLGVPSILLMENAKNAFMKHVASHRHYLVLCGTGNNGGDGLAIARELILNHKDVIIGILGDPQRGTEDFKINYRILKNLRANIVDAFHYDEYEKFDIDDCIIDAVFGTGLEREIAGEYRRVIERVNQTKAYKMSVDIPSGIHGESGETMGVSFDADIVITFHRKKLGLQKIDAQVITEHIGIPDFVTDIILDQ